MHYEWRGRSVREETARIYNVLRGDSMIRIVVFLGFYLQRHIAFVPLARFMKKFETEGPNFLGKFYFFTKTVAKHDKGTYSLSR